jgi:hypothetical protein
VLAGAVDGHRGFGLAAGGPCFIVLVAEFAFQEFGDVNRADLAAAAPPGAQSMPEAGAVVVADGGTRER